MQTLLTIYEPRNNRVEIQNPFGAESRLHEAIQRLRNGSSYNSTFMKTLSRLSFLNDGLQVLLPLWISDSVDYTNQAEYSLRTILGLRIALVAYYIYYILATE